MADVKMVVVDGIRYRPEDAPKVERPAEKEAKAPANKARSASTK